MSWQKGKQDEFEALLGRYTDFIRIHISKFNLSRFGLDPEDISQEIRIKIWKVLKNEKEIANYPSYIKKIVHSSVIDLLRKWKREDRVFIHEKQKKISETKRDYLAGCQQEDQMKEAIIEAIDSLIESRRKVVKLFLLDMNIEEISAFYSWSQNKTRNLLYRGLSDLKNILRDKDINYENKQ